MHRCVFSFLLIFITSIQAAEKWSGLIEYGKGSQADLVLVSTDTNERGKSYTFEGLIHNAPGLSWGITVAPHEKDALLVQILNEKNDGRKKRVAWLAVSDSSYYYQALYLRFVHVERKFRGQGCARLLLDKTMCLLSETEWNCIYLQSYFRCWEMYQKWGFELTKEGAVDLLNSNMSSKSLIEMKCHLRP